MIGFTRTCACLDLVLSYVPIVFFGLPHRTRPNFFLHLFFSLSATDIFVLVASLCDVPLYGVSPSPARLSVYSSCQSYLFVPVCVVFLSLTSLLAIHKQTEKGWMGSHAAGAWWPPLGRDRGAMEQGCSPPATHQRGLAQNPASVGSRVCRQGSTRWILVTCIATLLTLILHCSVAGRWRTDPWVMGGERKYAKVFEICSVAYF